MFTKTHIIALAALILTLVSSAVLAFVLFEVYSAGKELEARAASIAERNAKVKMYTEFSRLIEASKDERDELATYVLTEDKTSSFLTEIETLGRKMGVSLMTLSLGVTGEKDSFDNLQIEFSMTGSERAVKDMFALLENLPYHSSLSSASFTRMDGGVSATVNLSVSLLKYEQ